MDRPWPLQTWSVFVSSWRFSIELLPAGIIICSSTILMQLLYDSIENQLSIGDVLCISILVTYGAYINSTPNGVVLGLRPVMSPRLYTEWLILRPARLQVYIIFLPCTLAGFSSMSNSVIFSICLSSVGFCPQSTASWWNTSGMAKLYLVPKTQLSTCPYSLLNAASRFIFTRFLLFTCVRVIYVSITPLPSLVTRWLWHYIAMHEYYY